MTFTTRTVTALAMTMAIAGGSASPARAEGETSISVLVEAFKELCGATLPAFDALAARAITERWTTIAPNRADPDTFRIWAIIRADEKLLVQLRGKKAGDNAAKFDCVVSSGVPLKFSGEAAEKQIAAALGDVREFTRDGKRESSPDGSVIVWRRQPETLESKKSPISAIISESSGGIMLSRSSFVEK
jgi:hypothetical protein